jgi:hypothetical protein
MLNLFSLFLIIPDLMDYPESEEEGNSQQDMRAAANSILDADDTEMTDGTGMEANL